MAQKAKVNVLCDRPLSPGNLFAVVRTPSGFCEPGMKERTMLGLRKDVLHLYVDRSTQQWIVLDKEGNYWIVPTVDENPWDQRQPFDLTEETELVPIPGHYKHMLGLPA